MGARGPVPKRSSERAGHRTKAERPDRVKAEGEVRIPPASQDWATEARAWYRSLKVSGQSRFYEPSDWAYAHLLATLLSKQLRRRSGPSAEMMKAILSGMDSLGTTEGARRRIRIEIERPRDADPEDAKKVAVLDRYRQAVGAG